MKTSIRCDSVSPCEICIVFLPSKKQNADSWLSPTQLTQWIAERCQMVSSNSANIMARGINSINQKYHFRELNLLLAQNK